MKKTLAVAAAVLLAGAFVAAPSAMAQVADGDARTTVVDDDDDVGSPGTELEFAL